MARRPVFRVAVSFGRRPVLREYLLRAPDAAVAMKQAVRCARGGQLPAPIVVDAVIHVGDLDRPPRARRSR